LSLMPCHVRNSPPGDPLSGGSHVGCSGLARQSHSTDV